MSDGAANLLIRPGRRGWGIMGGTFDPIDHGHLVAASEVAHFFSIWMRWCSCPPASRGRRKAGRYPRSEDRYLMTVIATASNPRFSVSRVDIDRPG